MNSASIEEQIKDLRKTLRNGFDSIRNRLDKLSKQQDELLALLRRIKERMQDGEEWKRSIDDEEWEV